MGKFRNECLSLEWFRNRTEAWIGIEHWRRHDNEERPHMSLGDLIPAEFKAQVGATHGWPVCEPEGEVEAERRPLHRAQGVQVDRDRAADDLVEEVLAKLDLALPERARVRLALAPPELRETGNRCVQRGFPPRILVEQRDRAPKQPPPLIPKSGVLVAAGAVDAHLPHELRERITEDELWRLRPYRFAVPRRRNRPWRSSANRPRRGSDSGLAAGQSARGAAGVSLQGIRPVSPRSVSESLSESTTSSRQRERPARRTLTTFEQEGRRVFALEIEPAYVDVSVTRWEDVTGQKATRKR